jgi:hypothetical protein
MGQSPLDSLLNPGVLEDSSDDETPDPPSVEPSRAVAREKKTSRRQGTATTSKQSAKIRATFHISADLLDECRDTVVALSGPPERLTMAQLAEDAFRRELDRLRKKHNDSERFPPRSGDLRGGRPIGS